jgi:transcriptional regulator with XRE-family HTH domain
MKFHKYVKQTGKKRSVVAKELNISKPYLSMLLNGKRKPSADLCVRIEDWSKMDVISRELRR